MLFSNFLNERTVVATLTDGEAHLVFPIIFNAVEACLDLFDLGINCQVVFQNKMDSVGRYSTALSHEDSLSSLVKTDVR